MANPTRGTGAGAGVEAVSTTGVWLTGITESIMSSLSVFSGGFGVKRVSESIISRINSLITAGNESKSQILSVTSSSSLRYTALQLSAEEHMNH